MTFMGRYSEKGFSVRVTGEAVQVPTGIWSGFFVVTTTLRDGQGLLEMDDGARWRVRIQFSAVPFQSLGLAPEEQRYTFRVLEALP